MAVRVRYAPSATGSPHVGNLRTAIYCWLLARNQGGQFLARLEDTDRKPERYKPEGIWDIEESLRFLGIVPDEWWVGGGPVGPYVQSERLSLYQQYAEQMLAEGKAYRCYCTPERLERVRQAQQAAKQPTGYDRNCRNPEQREAMRQQRMRDEGTEDPSFVVRLAMPLEGQTVLHDEVRGDIVYENALQDDQVLLKSDGFPTYFLACAVDDHHMGITHIIRGDDWLGSAPKLVQVFKALGWETPKFIHPPLIIGADKKKLGKRHGSTQFTEFIAQGYLPEALFNFLVLLGWSAGDENRELFTISELVERFSPEGMSVNPAIFDYDKLKNFNGHYIRASEPGRIIGLCLPHLVHAGLISAPPPSTASDGDKAAYEQTLVYARRVIMLELERLKIISDIVAITDFFFRDLQFPDDYDAKAVEKRLRDDFVRPLLERQLSALEALPDWTTEALDACVHAVAEEMGLSLGQVVHPIRVAVTGRTVGPGLFETLWALGRDRTVIRLRRVLEKI